MAVNRPLVNQHATMLATRYQVVVAPLATAATGSPSTAAMLRVSATNGSAVSDRSGSFSENHASPTRDLSSVRLAKRSMRTEWSSISACISAMRLAAFGFFAWKPGPMKP